MIDFSCPRCGAGPYHAEESHLGKKIRCTRSGCEETITIGWQDGRYTTTGQQIKPKNQGQSKGVSIGGIRNSRLVFVGPKWSRGAVFASMALLLAGILFAWYYFAAPGNNPKSVLDMPTRQVSQPLTEGQVDASNQEKSLTTGYLRNESIAPQNTKPLPRRKVNARTPNVQEIPLPANSLPTGTRLIADQATSGSGELESINGTQFDACVIVLNNETMKRVRKVYVKSQDSFMMGKLNPGNYKVIFATCIDWDNQGERFNRESSYFEFGKVLYFREDGNSYEKHTITLNPVSDGNVRARKISEAEFHALAGKVNP